ncbi:Asp-tRNA(Asn)/Glu-tRNA(Gln) amidotransferase GatCAB subunit B, partial [Francisella tularensis subsp. holarctica]|nr:Asp-tRNA(Asn)/Glu-tRNA(Gln) amidotransferase GatCAB subunit B [Francisella tularensis subsp. holarctica]
DIIANVQKDIRSKANAKNFISDYFYAPSAIEAFIEKLGLKQVSDDGMIRELFQVLIASYPKQADDFKSGNTTLMSFFVGHAMKA